MRAIKTLADAQIIINAILNRLDRIETKNFDRKGLRLINNGDAVDSQDYVTLKQLQSSAVPSIPGNDYFSIPFSDTGVVAVGDLIPPYNPGNGRTGKPYQVILDAINPPLTTPLTMNVQINGVSILKNPISFPVSGTQSVFSSDFIPALPMVAFGIRVQPVVISADGATSGVTITLVVQKT